jgi:molecular chaperone GrpE
MAPEDKEKGFTVSDRRFWVDGGAGDDATSSSGAGPAEPRFPSYIEQLRADLTEKDRQLREYIAAYKEQVVKGIDDTKDRLEREHAREIERVRGRVVGDLLEVLDNLDRSIQAADQTNNLEALARGVRLVREQFATKLAELGLAPFAAQGQKFDPASHEAATLAEVTDPALDGTVVQVIQPGYKIGDRVLRPAIVQVGKLKQ